MVMHDLSKVLQDGERVQFRNGEYGIYCPWSDNHHSPSTLVFELETPGLGMTSMLNLKRKATNWFATHLNGLQDPDGQRVHDWDIVSEHPLMECPW